MIKSTKLPAVLMALCLLCTLPGAAPAQTAEPPPDIAETGGWPPELIGSWVGLHENLWRQYTFYQNGKYGMTVFESPDLDRSGTRDTFPKMEEIAFEGELLHFTYDGVAGTFRRIDEPFFRVKARDQTAYSSVNQRLVGTWGGRIEGTYIEWTFGADGGFSQFTPAEAYAQEGHYIAGGLELAVKMGGKIIHCAYLIRQDTVTVDLPDAGKVILNRKAGQLTPMSVVDNGDILWMWQSDREPKGEIVWRYLGSHAEVGMSPGGYTPVVGIGDEAFKGNGAVKMVTIPSFVTSIGAAAFEGCESLKDVLFIGRETAILFPGWEGVKVTAAEYFMYELNGMPAMTGDCPLKTIGEGAFRGCASLENLNIAKSAQEPPLFQYIPLLGQSDVKGINIPDGVTSIGAYAFEGCGSITSVVIPDSVTEIGMNAFKGCGRVTLIVSKDSYPMRYARNYGIPFILRGE